MTFFNRQNPLFFRKDGALDFGPAVWALTAAIALALLVLDAFGHATVRVEAYAFLGAFATITSIAGAYAERAYWIAQSRTPGEVARGIAEATAGQIDLLSPLVYRDIDPPDPTE